MLTDGLKFIGSAAAVNLVIDSGATLPTTGLNVGVLFYQTGVGLMIYNGTAWDRVGPTVAQVIPYDIAGSIFGKPTAPSLVFRFVANRAFSLPAGLTGSRATTSTAATAATILNIYKNGAVIGTINFAAGAAIGTFTFNTATNFVAGDLLTVGFPTADATFGDAQFTFAATLA